MSIDILTLFPEMFKGPFDQSIIKRAQNKGLVEINYHDLRDFAIDERGTVDDRPYGGGVGMILMVEPIFKALNQIKKPNSNSKVVLMDPRGTKFTQSKAKEFSKIDQLIFICGHYEGFDERIKDYLVDESISIGDFVLTGGEIPAIAITDAVVRLIPGVLEKSAAIELESFSNMGGDESNNSEPYLEHPQYTRPEEFNGWKVPQILLSGNHGEIKKWRDTN